MRDCICRSPPKSLLQAPTSAPRSADYTNRLGLAAALRKKLGSGHLSLGARSSRGRHSGLRSEAIAEEQSDGVPVEKQSDPLPAEKQANGRPAEENKA